MSVDLRKNNGVCFAKTDCNARFQVFFEKYLESNIACYNEANHNHISVEDIAEEVERPERRRNYCYYSVAADLLPKDSSSHQSISLIHQKMSKDLAIELMMM
eukprot:TRINITY_DN6219_c0_g1_i3.p1 TRINITY_DN6219_c0_g1~~TRINITY_DN6219_c0_g1_i3.p1  ORF type:complete len:102 (-),score=1.88 TRINITY_DN6219_c0_g1_i3:239-544(-)